MKVIIVGAGGHAQVIADALLQRKKLGEHIDIVGFLDDDISLKGQSFLGITVLGTVEDFRSISFDYLVIGIGSNKIREELYNKFQMLNYKFFTVIHPKSIVADSVSLGEGTVIFAGAIVNTGSIIGVNSIINTAATIDHHAKIGSHVHIAPGVHLGGTVHIGDGSFLGIGTNVLPNLSIGTHSMIGAGSTVISNLPSNVTAVGTPAKITKKL